MPAVAVPLPGLIQVRFTRRAQHKMSKKDTHRDASTSSDQQPAAQNKNADAQDQESPHFGNVSYVAIAHRMLRANRKKGLGAVIAQIMN